MNENTGRTARARETARVRNIYDRVAPRYDVLIALAEALLFRGGGRWEILPPKRPGPGGRVGHRLPFRPFPGQLGASARSHGGVG